MSSEGRPLLTIVADTCGRHDTLGGACSAESNQVRYALEKKYMHNCRDSFLLALARYGHGMTQARSAQQHQLLHERAGHARRARSPSRTASRGRAATSRCGPRRDVLVLISNCPQLNNPCNAYNPTPVRLLVWDGPTR